MSLPHEEQRAGRFLLKAGVAVVLLAGLVILLSMLLRPKPSERAGSVVGFSPPPVAAPFHLVVLRGGMTGCQPTGGCNDANYAQLIAAKEGWITTVLAAGGTGYVAGSQNTPATDFAARLASVYSARPDLVIVEGSVSDLYFHAADIQQAATTLFTDLKSNLPNAKVVVVGPAWGGTPPANVVAVEDAVKAAAAGRVAMFIDPIAEGWFSGANVSLMAADHQSPTDQGHARMAAMIVTDLAPLHLQPASSSPAA